MIRLMFVLPLPCKSCVCKKSLLSITRTLTGLSKFCIAELKIAHGRRFGLITMYTTGLLSEAYRTGNEFTGPRNPTYMHAVRAHLGMKASSILSLLRLAVLVGCPDCHHCS